MLQALSRTSLRSQARTLTQPLFTLTPRRIFHSEYDASREEQTCHLQDGRTLGFAEYGSRSADAVPAFFFHGGPGARYDGIAYHESGKKLNVRIICPDRPGHGLSTHDPSRKLVDYPAEISQLAKHLKLTKYHVFGQSGGGPFAVACAYGSPKDELLSTTVVAGMGPPECVTREMAGWYTVFALWFYVKTPRLLKHFFAWYSRPAFLNNDKRLQRSLDRIYKWLPKEDRDLLWDREGQPVIRAVIRAAFAQRGAGPIRDGEIYARKDLWGFELKDVQRHVQLIFGDRDGRTPVAFGRYYKAHLPSANLIELENATHITIGKYETEILAKVVGKEPPPKSENKDTDSKRELSGGSEG